MGYSFSAPPLRRVYRTLVVLTLGGMFSVWILYLIANQVNHRDNGFVRLFPPHPVLPTSHVLPLQYNSYYLAGHAGDTLYLGNITAPFHVVAVHQNLVDTQYVRIRLRYPLERLKRLTLSIDSPYFYLMDGIAPSLFRGYIGQWEATKFMYDSTYFTEAVPVGPSSLIVRAVMANREYALGRQSATLPHIRFDTTILQKQIDGLFCTDGILQYDRRQHGLLYLYHYRNEYIRFDTNLHVLERGRTIDTTSRAQIKVGSYSKGSTITMAAPPVMVNYESSVAGKYLFVRSGLRASNETEEMFRDAFVIDVYDLTLEPRERYKFSFYLYNHGTEKLKSFRVYGRTLYALYDHYLTSYTFNDRYFPPGH
ncbi:hypothetical protein [Parachryseolinea silvisoli]|uniref:hypothetical protein n=1 Tax=Parachryseolinea silvisoli TaxID=2873601 RepID=UPI0022659280|nr:hypothetical protein [Parachryseolinea silvisoli]MCD9018906.1 hypothetical protein [Parachryseolinea silvisoli]